MKILQTAIIGLFVASLSSASAATFTWTGSNASNHGWLQNGNYAGLGGTGTFVPTTVDTIFYSQLTGAASTAPVFGGAGTIGTLEFGAATAGNPITIAWQNTAVIQLASGVAVDAGAGASTINAPLVLVGSTVAFSNSSTSTLTFGRTLSGTSAVSITGGRFSYQGANTYTGPTMIGSSGTLLITSTGTTVSDITVQSTGALIGLGAAGNVTVQSGGLLSAGTPANPQGAFKLTGNLTLQSGALSTFELATATQDSINVGGLLTYGGELRLVLVSGFSALGDYTLFAAGSTASLLDSFTIYSDSTFLGALSLAGGIWSGTVSGQSYSFSQNSGVLTVVPEPGQMGLLALGGLFISLRYLRPRFRQ